MRVADLFVDQGVQLTRKAVIVALDIELEIQTQATLIPVCRAD